MTEITYGVWIPGKGWLRGDNNKTFGDVHKQVAQEVARRIGGGARVYYVDQSLVDLESKLLEAERLNAEKYFLFRWFTRKV